MIPAFAAGYVLAALLLAPDADAPAGASGIDAMEPGSSLLFGLPLLVVILAAAALVRRLVLSLRTTGTTVAGEEPRDRGGPGAAA